MNQVAMPLQTDNPESSLVVCPSCGAEVPAIVRSDDGLDVIGCPRCVRDDRFDW